LCQIPKNERKGLRFRTKISQPSRDRDTEEILKILVNQTEKISAIYLPNSESAYNLLYIHGNAEDLGDIRPLLYSFYSWGFSVFAYDYRGYGTSDGYPSEHNADRDADAAYNYLTQQLKILCLYLLGIVSSSRIYFSFFAIAARKNDDGKI
jgi:pimeloyl-ACP methyl ester carboxylesterase